MNMRIYNNTDGSTGSGYSSKGNQLKFSIDGKWYKSDFLGYEGAAEYFTTYLLKNSNIKDYVKYSMREISYNNHVFNGCESLDFLKRDQQLVTSERLFQSVTGKSLNELLTNMSLKEKIQFFVNEISSITNLEHFGEYLTTLLELDAVILNEDRHFHNIALIKNDNGTFEYCPLFDNGAAFLSDIRTDYALEKNVFGLIPNVHSKPFHSSFDQQMELCQSLYGKQLSFKTDIDISEPLKSIDDMYGSRVAERFLDIFEHQQYIYQDFFDGGSRKLLWQENKTSEFNKIKILNNNGCIDFITTQEFQEYVLEGNSIKLYPSPYEGAQDKEAIENSNLDQDIDIDVR